MLFRSVSQSRYLVRLLLVVSIICSLLVLCCVVNFLVVVMVRDRVLVLWFLRKISIGVIE